VQVIALRHEEFAEGDDAFPRIWTWLIAGVREVDNLLRQLGGEQSCGDESVNLDRSALTGCSPSMGIG
jgi:hypothetical protein